MPFSKNKYEAPFGRDLNNYTLEEISDLAIALSVAVKGGAIKIDKTLRDADELEVLREKDKESKNLVALASREAEEKYKEQMNRFFTRIMLLEEEVFALKKENFALKKIGEINTDKNNWRSGGGI